MLKYLHEKNIPNKEKPALIMECKANQFELQGLEIGKSRKIIVRNDGKVNSSDAGFLLLQQVVQKHRMIEINLNPYSTL